MLYILIAIVLVEYLFDAYLNYLNSTKWNSSLPEELAGIYDPEQYKKSQDYEREKHGFKSLGRSINLIVIVLMLYFGGFAFIDNYIRSITEQPVLNALLFFGFLFFAFEFISIPLAIYGTFVIEERFGFNKTTKRTFILDIIKAWILAGIIGGCAISLIIWFYLAAGGLFWIYAWSASSAFLILTAMFFTTVIVPIFNRLTPLEKGELENEIKSLCDNAGFPLDDVSVIDGSKRSAKANAFFSGLGAKRKIVLFDTLIKSFSTNEIIAVLAHEIGHFKKKHVLKNIMASILKMGLFFYVLSLTIDNQNLSRSLGSEYSSFHLGLVSFAILYGPAAIIIGLFSKMNSRKQEFEADKFAKNLTRAADMADALKKLSVNHLSNLTPHPAYVVVHYTHPPVLERLRALTGLR